MSLTHPSVGEFLDRLAILRLKIRFGEDHGKDVAHFRQEQKDICTRLQDKADMNHPLVEELFFVNEALWELTDAIREAIKQGERDWQIGRFGRLILEKNDKRASLIAKISAQYGDYRIEKLS